MALELIVEQIGAGGDADRLGDAREAE